VMERDGGMAFARPLKIVHTPVVDRLEKPVQTTKGENPIGRMIILDRCGYGGDCELSFYTMGRTALQPYHDREKGWEWSLGFLAGAKEQMADDFDWVVTLVLPDMVSAPSAQ
ncbi:hypothetical protein FRC19_005792, partial [Serendipita sp. 401]